MDDRKAKKIADGLSKSKSPRECRPHLEESKKRESSGSKFKVIYAKSRSRSHTRERKRSRHDQSPRSRHHQSPVDRRQRISSSRYESSYKAKRHHSQSPLQNDSRQQFETLQEEKPSRVLGVFGLSLYTDERVLQEVFTQYGPVEGIQVILDHYSGVSRGFAFVYMKHLQDAIQARELAPGTEIDGRKIRVDYSVTDFSSNPNLSTGYMGRPVQSRPYQNVPDLYHHSSRRSSPPSYSRDHLYGNGSRYFRDRSRSYSPRHF